MWGRTFLTAVAAKLRRLLGTVLGHVTLLLADTAGASKLSRDSLVGAVGFSVARENGLS